MCQEAGVTTHTQFRDSVKPSEVLTGACVGGTWAACLPEDITIFIIMYGMGARVTAKIINEISHLGVIIPINSNRSDKIFGELDTRGYSVTSLPV